MSSSSSPDSQSPTIASPSMSSTHGSPSNDLKHMLSQGGLTTHSRETVKERVSSRASHRLSSLTAKVGSRSPNSIPSSPTSVHSSSSAIFERDIEPLVSSSPPYPPHMTNPHRIPRSKGTEHLDQSVPSVLDSAAAVLTATLSAADEEQIAVISPACGSRSGVASPIGSLRSRSPSPLGSNSTTAANRASLLLSIPGQAASAYTGYTTTPTPFVAASAFNTKTSSPPSQSPSSATRPTIRTNVSNTTASSTPSIVTPTSAYYSLASSGSSPTTTTLEHPPHVLPSTNASTKHAPLNLSHPPSPTNVANKRLSFMSYSDLLTSTPASTSPLSSLTTSASSEPPPHIPSVSGLTQMQATLHSSNASVYGMSVKEGDAPEDVGGEWEREGLGRGLEERLEALMGTDIKV